MTAALLGATALAGGLLKPRGADAPEAPAPAPAPAASPAEVPAPVAPPLFPNGLPVAIQQTPPGLANLSAQGCNACHWEAHDAWQGTPHAAAWSDPRFQQAIDRTGGSTACRGCHLPLANQHPRLAAGYLDDDPTRPRLVDNPLWDPTLMGEGVTCAACHVRDGVVVGARAAPGAPHPVAVSAELSDSRFCATCHQLTWPGASAPFYDTWGEWQASAYAAAGVGCQDCHMPLQAGAAVASTWAAAPAHTFEADAARALSLLLELGSPEVHRGQAWSVKVRIQNTGAGHAVPTGSPFKTYVVAAELVGADGKALAPGGRLELGRTVSDGPPWDILSDHRVPPGGELVMEHRFEVPAKASPQSATLQLTLRRADDPPDAPPLLRRSLPVPVL